MAHLCLNPKISFNKLVESYNYYYDCLKKAEDKFERAEIEGFLATLTDFCVLRGGFSYLEKVRTEAGVIVKKHPLERRYKNGTYQ